MVTTESQPFAIASANKNSSLRSLLPPSSTPPVASSRFMYRLIFNAFSLDRMLLLLPMLLLLLLLLLLPVCFWTRSVPINCSGVGKFAKCNRPCLGTLVSFDTAQDGGLYGCTVSGCCSDGDDDDDII